MTLTWGEAARKGLHILVGGFALLLRWMTWREAAAMALLALLFNWQVLPRLGGRALWREIEHGRGYPPGILLYPLSVLGLVLAFRDDLWRAAAVWGVLAWGDGMASLAGQGLGGPRLPWNAAKSWAGFAAFVAFGTAAAATLTVWTLRLPLVAIGTPWVVAGSLLLALVCGVVESLPTPLDDNLTVPFAGGLALGALGWWKEGGSHAAPPAEVAMAVAVSAVAAVAAWRARAMDAAGAASTFLIGAAITAALGLPGFAVIAAFFFVGTAATRLRHRTKAARGLAQEGGGTRGWRNAWANGGVPCALALGALSAPPETRSLWVLAYAASVASAAADTCSSEVGKAYGRRTVLVTTGRPVAPGTEGGVSGEGTLAGLCGAAAVAAVGLAGGLYGGGAAVIVTLAGAAGALAESVVGALAGGRAGLGNHALNALNTAIGAALAVIVALAAR